MVVEQYSRRHDFENVLTTLGIEYAEQLYIFGRKLELAVIGDSCDILNFLTILMSHFLKFCSISLAEILVQDMFGTLLGVLVAITMESKALNLCPFRFLNDLNCSNEV